MSHNVVYPLTAEQSHVEGSQMTRRDLTTNEVANALKAAGVRGGSRPTVIRWTDDGYIPHRVGPRGNYRYYRPEVVDLLVYLFKVGVSEGEDTGSWLERVSEQLRELHDKLAERDRLDYEQ